MVNIRKTLKREFMKLNVRYGASTEFYDTRILNLIEPYIKLIGLNYRILTDE